MISASWPSMPSRAAPWRRAHEEIEEQLGVAVALGDPRWLRGVRGWNRPQRGEQGDDDRQACHAILQRVIRIALREIPTTHQPVAGVPPCDSCDGPRPVSAPPAALRGAMPASPAPLVMQLMQ